MNDILFRIILLNKRFKMCRTTLSGMALHNLDIGNDQVMVSLTRVQ